MYGNNLLWDMHDLMLKPERLMRGNLKSPAFYL